MGVGPIAILAVTLLAWNAFYFYLSTTFSVASLTITSATGARFGPPDPTNVIHVGGDGAGRGLDPTIGAVHGGVDRGFVDRELVFLEFAWKYPTHPVDPRRKSVDIDHKDAYSGSWWQSTSAFVSTQSFEGDESLTPSQEDATFEAFQASGMNVSATRDWLDLSVEHMSKWWLQALPDFRSRETAARSVVGKISFSGQKGFLSRPPVVVVIVLEVENEGIFARKRPGHKINDCRHRLHTVLYDLRVRSYSPRESHSRTQSAHGP
jgi:hypothetical protein